MAAPRSSSPTPDPGPPHMRVEMLSCPRLLAGARELVASLARRLGFDEVGACQVALAVDEALANVIRHGYDRREDQPIWMTIWQLDAPQGPATDANRSSAQPPAPASTNRTPVGLRIVIEDQGKQTDPDQIKGRDLDDIRPGGLGVHIIREVMDEAVYEKRPAGGMKLTLVKRLHPVNDAALGASPSADPPAPVIPSAALPATPKGNVHG